MRIPRWTLLAAGIAVGAATAAHATDGVIEINQARALAGSVTAGDEPGFPVEIHTRGSFRLTGDLAVPGAAFAGIAIYASGTRLDLNGFAITSATQCSGVPLVCAPAGTGIGIDASGASDVAIANGRVSGFGVYGIYLFEGSRAERLSVEDNASGGILTEGGCVIADNLVRRNGGPGIQVGSGSRVSANVVSGNKGFGADLAGTTAFAQNVFEANAAGSVSGGRATSGNVCDDKRCSSRGTRRFYLTTQAIPAVQALGACVAGFHMASAWEIFEVSTLEYATPLGATNEDAGSGPPMEKQGWIRTGLYPYTGSLFDAVAPNCNVWTSSSSNDSGSALQIPSSWGDTTSQRVAPWLFTRFTCDTSHHVWCIED